MTIMKTIKSEAVITLPSQPYNPASRNASPAYSASKQMQRMNEKMNLYQSLSSRFPAPDNDEVRLSLEKF